MICACCLLLLIIFADAHFSFLRKLTNELLFRFFVAFLARSISIDLLLVSYDYGSKPDNLAGTCKE